MEIRAGAQVRTANDEVVGNVDRVVIDPGTLEVTSLVVQKGFLFTTDKVVPVDWIASADQDRVYLKTEVENFDDLPDYEETNYLLMEEEDPEGQSLWEDYLARPYYWYPPLGYGSSMYPGFYGMPPARVETERNIPEGTIALEEGVDVFDKNGDKIGSIERIFTDSSTNQATHFVVSSGVLLQERKLIPIHWVTHFEEDRVDLEVGSRFLERLPPYQETS